ncbi:MAG: hypothetical protein JWP37_890 [Mucilaginibacter sp.]|nr:hypothetical protein [Mucilaginibacter sp.]
MKHIYRFTFLFFLFPFLSYAQNNYKPGYVVNSKGDTLRGFIDYKEWDNSPKYIAFESKLNQSKPEIFTTNAANEFAIIGQQYYQRYVVQVSLDPVDVANIGSKLDTSYRMDTVFLRVLNKGRYLTLYSYRDDIKSRFYLLGAGQTQPHELIYHAYYNQDESSSIRYVKRFHNQLQNILQQDSINSDKISSEINQSNYSETDLTKIVQTINGNSSKQFVTPRLFGTRWFAGLGVNYSNLKFVEGSGQDYGGNRVTNKTSVFPKVTAGIDFFGNKNTQALVLRAEFSFTANQYKFSNRNNSAIPQSTSILNFKQYNNSIMPQIIYNMFNKEDLKVFIGAGASFNLSLYNHNQYITKYDGAFTDYVQNNSPSPFYMSFPIRAGIELNKKIEINICYIPSSTILHSGVFSEAITSYQVGLNYLFGK